MRKVVFVLLILLVLILVVGVVTYSADGVPVAASSSLWGLPGEFVGAVIELLLFGLGWLFFKNARYKPIADLAIQVYGWALNAGLLKNTSDDFRIFMEKFITAYRERFGKDPTPADNGIAAYVMQKQRQQLRN